MSNINREFITINKYTIASLLYSEIHATLLMSSQFDLASNTNLLHPEINITNEDYKLSLILSNIISKWNQISNI